MIPFNTRPVLLKYKPVIDELRQKYGQKCSSHAFASLYLWKEIMGLSLLFRKDMYTVKCTGFGKNTWFFPCGDQKPVRDFLEEKMKEPDFVLCYMRPGDVKWVERQFPGFWKFRRVTDAEEYLYDVRGHVGLKGKTYANMRTQVHKVEREYTARSVILDDTNVDDAMFILREWSRKKKEQGESDPEISSVDETALLMRKELGISGIILYLDEKPTALTAGFYLDQDTYDVAVAKSISTAQGVSYYSKRELFRRLSCPFVNMEEDLGIPGLRRMKKGMRPVRVNEMWEGKRR